MTARGPYYWQYETSGVLRPVVEAYLRRDPMTPEQIAAMRAYLRQWIFATVWQGDEIAELRDRIDRLTSIETLDEWFLDAETIGIDPL